MAQKTPIKKKQIKYLDPKNDLTFRKIFGEHPHLLISFLNSMLPLPDGEAIVSIEYMDNEIIPELPGFKRSLVDVRCKEKSGRAFIVEMQMYWTSAFSKRVLFNAGKAYVKQLKGGAKYRDLKPVYALSLIDDTFQNKPNLKDEYYHHYSLVHTLDKDERIEGLELVFVELPKFELGKFSEKRLRSLWLRFLTEIDENTNAIPDEFKNDESISEALECVQRDAFTEEELQYYEQYWDSVRIEKVALEEERQQKEEALNRAKEAELEIAKAKAREEDERRQKEEAKAREEDERRQKEEAKAREEEERRQKEEAKAREEQMIINMKNAQLTLEQISQISAKSIDEVKAIIAKHTEK